MTSDPREALSRARRKRIRQLHHRRGREAEGAFLVEGVRGAREALASGIRVQLAVVSPRLEQLGGGEHLLAELRDANVPVASVSDRELGKLAATQTPQGVLLVCAIPEQEPLAPETAPERVLLLDAIQDPGNAGTLMRSAFAFGVDRVLLLDGCVDPYNPKTVRASAGLVARVRPTSTDLAAALAALRSWELPLLVAETGGVPCRALRLERWALAIGNEGAGVRPQLRDAADEFVSIPMRAGAESLNAAVAGSILMFSLGTGS